MRRNFKFVGWEDVENSCLSIYSQMCSLKYKPDAIIALFRGGVIPGRIFSDYFNILLDFFALDVKMYENMEIAKDAPYVKPFYGDVKGKKILVVDDIWDTGLTMKAVLDYLGKEDVTTATLFWKETAKEKPTYYANVAKENTWIVYPWERYEFYREIETQ